jgi:gamma-glutamylputrescine oxidase
VFQPGGSVIINQNWWFSTLLVKQFQYCPPLNKDIKCDVLVVGGGMSGISAAAEFLRQGLAAVFSQQRLGEVLPGRHASSAGGDG